MFYRSPTPADITELLRKNGCSEEVVFTAVRSIDLVELLLESESFSRVVTTHISECQFFENHVLQDEMLFSQFYNQLLEIIKVEENELENEDTYDEAEESSASAATD